jgi:micrococcal nuclease
MRVVLFAMLVLIAGVKPLDDAIALFTIVDGDTVILGEERIRLSNIDAPEVRQAQCEAEAALGRQASARLRFLLAQGPASVQREGTDRFGRTLARISVAGRDVGDRLVAEGLARRWDGRRQPWC